MPADLQNRLFSRFLSKLVPPIPSENERTIYPERLNPISWLFFWWLHPVMRTGYKRTLAPEDLFALNDKVKVEALSGHFESRLYSSLADAKHKHIEESLEKNGSENGVQIENSPTRNLHNSHPKLVVLWALLLTFKLQYGLACIYMILANVAGACNPLLSRKLIQFVQNKTYGDSDNSGKGVGYALGCSFMVLVVGILFNHSFMNSMITGCQGKGILIKAILNKSFRLSQRAAVEYPLSKITSLMGTDVSRIEFALAWQPVLVAFPFSLGISIGILIYNIGAVSLVGVGMILVYLGVISFAVSRVYKFRIGANKFTDERVGHVKEILSNLKAIKFYCWEDAYERSITETRNLEMEFILKMQLVRSIIVGTSVCMTLFASMTSFLALYGTSGSTKDPASLFSSISLFNNLASQIIVLPAALSSGSDAIIGLKRLGEYFAAEEDTEPEKIEETQQKTELTNAISLENVTFKWDGTSNSLEKQVSVDTVAVSLSEEKSDGSIEKSKTDPVDGLRNVNLQIDRGMLVVVTGRIGSGKSALLNSIAGFIRPVSGQVSVDGSVLLCEHHWIQNATVKENILFGEAYNEQRYSETIYACSLESDLEILPAGDQTEIGERGITLSGGQKARISLARAVYANKDIILLDDVLSAVDARVAKHIMDHCVLGLLAGKTRILATHQISLISDPDLVVFLNGDGNIDQGTLEDLKSRNGQFRALMSLGTNTIKPEGEENSDVISQASNEESKAQDNEAVRKDFNANQKEDGKLTKDERRAVNSIKFQIYNRYIRSGSGRFPPYFIAIALAILEILAHFCEIFTNTWLSFWADYKFASRSNQFYYGLYIMFTFLAYFFLIFAFLSLAYMTNTSSEVLNLKAVHRVLHTPMSLMDVTPMGRILNRFTKDTDVLDNEIGNELRVLMYFMGSIAGILILCVIYLPYFAIAIPFLGFLFVAIGNFYQASAREIKRLEAVQRSFIYNNFNEILSGMMTIKAYNAEDRFKLKNDLYINKTNEASFLTVANQRWLSIHLDAVASLFALIISLLCVFRVFDISAASTGLLLSYVLLIAGLLSVLIRTLTLVENQMNSVERLCEYGYDLEQEPAYERSDTKPSPTWPSEGSISFKNVSMSYRPNLPLVLQNVLFDVNASEKIGICGRTGAGKSSIITALYRIVELQQGEIAIDGVDISHMGLKDLRSKLSIIPQDPVLFKGTIRKNLDPFGDFADTDLWASLAKAGLVEESDIESFMRHGEDQHLPKFHLDSQVEENGVNFSLGELQLLAFTRALVRDTKILILDEATSSVDYKTDNKIQETIAHHFNNCTVLCIAHRLKTILKYDRIIVMEKGEVAEFGKPAELFSARGSIFLQLCAKSNITVHDFA